MFTRAVLDFDLSNIPGLPANANIIDVSFSFYFLEGDTGTSGDLCSLYVVAKKWNESEVTWKNATSSDPWEQLDRDTRYYSNEVGDTVEFPGGGDRIFPCAAMVRCANVWNPWETYDITDVMQKYIKNPAAFHGLLFKPYMDNTSRWYASSEYSEVDKRPKLVIKYSGTGILTNREAEIFSDCHISTAGNHIRIFIPLQNSYEVVISDLRGREVHSFSGNGNRWYSVPQNFLPAGSYVLRVASSGKRIIKSFITVK